MSIATRTNGEAEALLCQALDWHNWRWRAKPDFKVEESPAWREARTAGGGELSLWKVVKRNWPFCVYAVLIMAAFNFFSHGTQDIYPTFLKEQHGFDPHDVSLSAIGYNIAAILGGLFFGSLSQKIGRRYAIMAAALASLLVVYPWAYSQTFLAVAASACAMQFMVQGAWGVVPVYLNELAPAGGRAVLPGFVYQIGNFVASLDGPVQTGIAANDHGNYSFALLSVPLVVAIVIAVFAFFGRETRGVQME